MLMRRTDLAAEALDLAEKSGKTGKDLPGVRVREREECGFSLTEVEIFSEEGEKALGKPCGRYVTVDIRRLWRRERESFAEAVEILGGELQRLLPQRRETLLAVGLGNAVMTADALGPLAVKHILPTRHLRQAGSPFSTLPSLSLTAAEVVGKTGVEAAEQAAALCTVLKPDAVIVMDALAGRSVHRVCHTVQLSDVGLVPGSGVGNHRHALTEETLGVPVISLGVPTVVDGATLALDLLEEAGVSPGESCVLRRGLFVTPKEIDERVQELARLLGWAVNAAVLGLSTEESAALLG